MKCLLHIGTEKTGTTLLQDWLLENRDALSHQRVYLPTSLGKRDHRWFTAFFQRKPDEWFKRKGIRTTEDKAKVFEGFAERFIAEVRQAEQQHDLFVITSEHLHSRIDDREAISDIREFLDKIFEQTTILCYFRDQADMAVSLYSTALKTAHTAQLDDFLARTVSLKSSYYDFQQIADDWSAVFGRDRCIFRLYDRTKFKEGDLRQDFLSCLPHPIDASRLTYDTTSRNESLPPLVAAAFRQINTHLPYWGEDGGISQLNTRLKSRIAALESLQSGKIDSPRKPAIRSMFKARNTAFLAKYFAPTDQFAVSAPQPPVARSFALEEVEAILEGTLSAVLSELQPEATAALLGSDAEYLRDIALKIEQGTALSLQDAAALMTLALRARPKGQFIRKKAEAYAARLKQQGGS